MAKSSGHCHLCRRVRCGRWRRRAGGSGGGQRWADAWAEDLAGNSIGMYRYVLKWGAPKGTAHRFYRTYREYDDPIWSRGFGGTIFSDKPKCSWWVFMFFSMFRHLPNSRRRSCPAIFILGAPPERCWVDFFYLYITSIKPIIFLSNLFKFRGIGCTTIG